MFPAAVTTEAPPEPTDADLDHLIDDLNAAWKTTVTVRRQSPEDIGIRQIYVSLDGRSIAVLLRGQQVVRDVTPGPHRLRVHNTLFWKTVEFTVDVGERVCFTVINRKGFATYSFLAYLLGTNPIYLSVERETGA